MIEVQKLWKGSHYYMYAFSTRLNMCVLCPALRYPGRDRSLIICPNLWDFTGIVRRCWSERRDCGGICPDLDVWRARRKLSFKVPVGIAATHIEHSHCCKRKIRPREPAREP